ncbi:MAG: hypothetical protein PW845_18295 [Pseudomonas sp.]|nr:hypothetical protein [Pseudomonas sp.]
MISRRLGTVTPHTIDLTPQEVEKIVSYYQVSHPGAGITDITALKAALQNFESRRANDGPTNTLGTKFATSLAGSAALGLAGAVIAPMVPGIALIAATVGAIVGWLAIPITRDEHSV